MTQENQQISEDISSDPEMAVRLLGSVSQIIAVINSGRVRFEDRMDKILHIILDYLGVEQGSIMVLGKARKYLEVIAASKSEIIGVRQDLDEDTVATWVVKQKKPLFVPDISRDSRFQKRGSTYRKNALLSAPILSDDEAVVVINVTDKSGNKDFFKEDIAYLLNFSSMVLWLVLQQKLNDEVKKQKNTLKKRNAELREQEKARAELSKMLIHDLKGPLSEVIANLDILSYSIEGENAEFLKSAQIGCERTEQMVSNLGAIDKIEDGKLRLIKEKVDPEALLQEAINSSKGMAKIKNIQLALEKPPESLSHINLDRVLILRVFQNLLTNGIGHSPPNSEIIVGCRQTPNKKHLEFYVQDAGPGVPLSKQKSIFEKYYRLSDKQDSLVGTGLGLYFCRLAVQEHRGKIWVESAPGRGSRFCFVLPIP